MRFTCGLTCLQLLTGYLISVHGAQLRCYRTLDDYEVASLDKPERLLSTTCYDSSRSNLVYAHGFNRGPNTYDTVAIISAALDLTDLNVILLDWEKEARGIQNLGQVANELSYAASAVPETVKVGRELGEALLKLYDIGFDFENTEVMGHSLGAQLIGNTGRHTKKHGKMIALLTGLDPAGPIFDVPITLVPALDRTCGRHVRVYHTDPGYFGTNVSRATADYWANFGNFVDGPSNEQVQPGCPTTSSQLGNRDLCSHDRSWQLRIETWRIKGSLLGLGASNYNEWLASEDCKDEDISALDDVRDAKGNYYFTTNGESPYGEYTEGACPPTTEN